MAVLSISIILILLYLVGFTFSRAGFSVGKNASSLANVMTTGLVWSLGIFQVLFLPCCIFDAKYTLLKWLYISVLLCIGAFGVIKWKSKTLAPIKSCRRISKDFWTLLCAVLALGLMLLILISNVAFIHYDGDDQFFVMLGVLSAELNRIYRVVPFLNVFASLPENSHYFTNGWYMLVGFLYDITGLHHSTFAQLVLPVFLSVFVYLVLAVLAEELFEEKWQRWLFLALFSVVVIFGYSSNYSAEAFFLFRLQQGKAFFADFCVPLFLVLFIRIHRSKVAPNTKKLAFMLLVSSIVSCMTTTTGLIISGGLISVYAVVISLRRWKQGLLPLMLMALIPNLVCGILYIIEVRYGIWL